MLREKYASDSDAEDKDCDGGPDDRSAGQQRFLGRRDEEQFGGLAAVGTINGHAGGFGGEFDVAAALRAFAF